MDYSKLSNEDLLALKAGDYAKLSNEGLLLIKGQEPSKQTGLEKTVGVVETIKKPFKKTGEFIEKNLKPGMGATQKALKGTIPGMGLTALGTAQNVFEQGGQAAAQVLPGGMRIAPGQTLRTSPKVAAGIGTGLAMTPDIAMLAAGGPGMARGATTMARGATTMARGATNPLRRIAEVITGPGEAAQTLKGGRMLAEADTAVAATQDALAASKQIPKELSAAKTELPTMQGRMAKLKSERIQLVQKHGKNIESFEANLGPLESNKIKQILENKPVLDATLKDLTELTRKGSKAIQDKMTAKDIRLMRQLVQEVGRNPEIALEGAQAAQINKALGKAMDTYKPGYSDALDMYKTAQDALKDVPNVKAMEVGKLRAQIKQMESAFTNSKLSKIGRASCR